LGPIISALLSGGLVMLWTLPQKSRAEKLENDAKVITEYAGLIDRYKHELEVRDNKIAELTQEVDGLRQQLKNLEDELSKLKRKRNSRGQYCKMQPYDGSGVNPGKN